MVISIAYITGKVVVPGTTSGIRALVTATPNTQDAGLKWPADNTVSWGPVSLETDDDGELPGSGLPIPLGSTVGADLVWTLKATAIDNKKLGTWRLGDYTITAGADLADMVPVVPTAVSQSAADINDAVIASRAADPSALTFAVLTDAYSPRWLPMPTRNPRTGFNGLKVHGVNLVGRQGTHGSYVEDWQAVWGDWNWDTWIKLQIDQAVLLGANTIRMIGSAIDAAAGGATQAAYFAKVDELIDYCDELGLYVYPCGGQPTQIVAGSLTVSDVAAGLAALAAHIEDRPNVIGLDLLQEVNAWWIVGANPGNLSEVDALANCSTIYTAVKAAAPTLPLTFSRSTSGTGVAGLLPGYTGLFPYMDFVDLHPYYNPASDALDGLLAATDMPIIIGEFGLAFSAGTTAQENRYRTVQQLIQMREVGGGLVWALADWYLDTDPTRFFGLLDKDFVRREHIASIFEELPISFEESRASIYTDRMIAAGGSTTTVRVFPTAMRAVGSSATNYNGVPTMSCPGGTDAAATMMVGPLPTNWVTFHIDFVFALVDTTTTNLRHYVLSNWVDPDATTALSAFTGTPVPVVTAGPGVTGQRVKIRLATSVANEVDKELLLNVTRDADHGDDTNASTSHIFEVILTKAT